MTRSRWGELALAVIAALPVALNAVPQMADLPNHIARHHVLARAVFGPPARWWLVDWRWIGNLGVDLPVIALSPLFGTEAATRLIVMLIAPLTALGLLALGRAAHGRVTAGAALALPFAFAQPWHYGFVNSCLSVALALFVAAAWVRRPPDSAGRAAVFGLAALGVWTAHVMGWGILLIVIAGVELGRLRTLGDLPRRIGVAAPLLLPVIPLLAWRGPGSGPAFVFVADPLQEKLVDAATVLKGISQPFDLAMTAGILVLAVVALATARAPRVDRGLGFGAVLLGGVVLAMPTTVLGSWGADLRLMPVVAMVALLALAPGRGGCERWLIAAGIALFVLRAGVITVSWHRDQPALAVRLELVERVPIGGRLGFIAAPDCRVPWRLGIEHKLASYAAVRRDAFVNTMFLIPGADLIHRREPADALWFDGSQEVACDDPGARAARVMTLARAGFDPIWLVGPAPLAPPPPGYRIVHRDARDTLFARTRLE